MDFSPFCNFSNTLNITSLISKKCVSVFVCMYVCLYICLPFRTHVNKTLFAKNSLYVRNKQPINFWAGKLWFKAANMYRFEIRVKRIYKDAVKAFPNGLYVRQIAEKQHSWPPRLLGIPLSRKGACSYENEEQL